MHKSRHARVRWIFPVAAVVLTIGMASAAGTSASAASRAEAAAAIRAAATSAVPPNASGELDCNGLSPAQHPVKAELPCKDPRGNHYGRFYDNGHYLGHDEPSIRFISGRHGSGSSVTFVERLPVEPAQRPTVSSPGHDVTHTFELTVAPWFSIDVCDPNSAPQAPCTPESDANAPNGSFQGAGAGFVELQFYAPGAAPFIDNISCDNTHWCSALNIDSLECSGSGLNVTNCNPNCIEPVNFAFVQTNGVPPGPPSPQLSDNTTFTPNRNTLLMNPGDTIVVNMFDAPTEGGHALEVRETDLNTRTSGFMIASAANGFMNTDPATCAGTPFSFQPEYDTASAGNILPWGIGPYMINTQFEIGHFEPCTSLSGPQVNGLGDTFYTNCAGPYEQSAENPNLEPDDAPCYPAGDTHGGTSAPNLVTGCEVATDAIGDLDYDGTPYYPDWPDSLVPGPFPGPFLQAQPITAGGRYPQIQFVTDASASELNTGCSLVNGQNCVLPPQGPGNFYPYFTQARVGLFCVWEFGNMTNGNTFGGDKQYGSVTPTTIGAFAGPVMPNPNC